MSWLSKAFGLDKPSNAPVLQTLNEAGNTLSTAAGIPTSGNGVVSTFNALLEQMHPANDAEAIALSLVESIADRELSKLGAS